MVQVEVFSSCMTFDQWRKDKTIEPAALPITLLYWREGILLDLIYTIHNNARWDEVAILADALEEFVDEEKAPINRTIIDHFRMPHKGNLPCLHFLALAHEVQSMCLVESQAKNVVQHDPEKINDAKPDYTLPAASWRTIATEDQEALTGQALDQFCAAFLGKHPTPPTTKQ